MICEFRNTFHLIFARITFLAQASVCWLPLDLDWGTILGNGLGATQPLCYGWHSVARLGEGQCRRWRSSRSGLGWTCLLVASRQLVCSGWRQGAYSKEGQNDIATCGGLSGTTHPWRCEYGASSVDLHVPSQGEWEGCWFRSDAQDLDQPRTHNSYGFRTKITRWKIPFSFYTIYKIVI